MSSQSYKIYRWDAVIFGNNNPTPIIYVKPDDLLLKFAKENDNNISVKINNLTCPYGGRIVKGFFGKSSDIPNARPYFFEKTGLYVIVLHTEWKRYPDDLGNCSIYGVKGGVPV